MYIKNQLISLGFKCLLIVICIWGLYLNSGLPNGNFVPQMFCYYTIQDNTAVLLFELYAAFKILSSFSNQNSRTITVLPKIKGALIMMLLYLFGSYHFFLLPQVLAVVPDYKICTIDNMIVHYIVPCLIIVDWLLFDEKNNLHWRDPMIWIVIPILYYVFVLLRAEWGDILYGTGSRYPYNYVDADIYGIETVLKNMIISIVWYFICGYIIVAADKAICWVRHKRKARATNQWR